MGKKKFRIKTMIKIHTAEHEGGTKFYRVAEISHNGKSVMVTNWGRRSLMSRDGLNGGETKVEVFSNDTGGRTAASNRMREKSGRGYFGWSMKKFQMEDLERLFKSRDAAMITAHLALGTDADAEGEPDPAPLKKPAKAKPAVEPDRGTEWGTW